ncbi:MAG: Ig-like domain repeat protein, partial [Edaphobacter sp.]
AEQHFLAGMGINSISAGDVNNDGRMDLVIANGGAVISNPASGQTVASTDVNTGGITVLLNQLTLVPTTTVLTISSPLTIAFGQAVNGTAEVTASDGSLPTGTISFYDGTTNLCTIAVTAAASCPAGAGTGFAVGSHVLTAVYSGDATHLGSTSAAVTVTVLPVPTKAQTVTMLTASVDPAASGQEVVFTANVLATGASTTPTGLVTFLDGKTVLGAASLVGDGVASLNISSLNVGSHAVTASYAGDANSLASVSSVMTETVSSTGTTGPTGFSVSVTGSGTISVGGTAKLRVTVASQTGYMQPVQLSCADLPSEATCTFSAQMIAAGGGTTALQVNTMAPRSCSVAASESRLASVPFSGIAVAGFLVLFIPGRRRKVKSLLVALIAICGMASLSGCGACTDLGTKPGTYTIRVIGSSGGSVVTTKVQVVVTE